MLGTPAPVMGRLRRRLRQPGEDVEPADQPAAAGGQARCAHPPLQVGGPGLPGPLPAGAPGRPAVCRQRIKHSHRTGVPLVPAQQGLGCSPWLQLHRALPAGSCSGPAWCCAGGRWSSLRQPRSPEMPALRAQVKEMNNMLVTAGWDPHAVLLGPAPGQPCAQAGAARARVCDGLDLPRPRGRPWQRRPQDPGAAPTPPSGIHRLSPARPDLGGRLHAAIQALPCTPPVLTTASGPRQCSARADLQPEQPPGAPQGDRVPTQVPDPLRHLFPGPHWLHGAPLMPPTIPPRAVCRHTLAPLRHSPGLVGAGSAACGPAPACMGDHASGPRAPQVQHLQGPAAECTEPPSPRRWAAARAAWRCSTWRTRRRTRTSPSSATGTGATCTR